MNIQLIWFPNHKAQNNPRWLDMLLNSNQSIKKKWKCELYKTYLFFGAIKYFWLITNRNNVKQNQLTMVDW